MIKVMVTYTGFISSFSGAKHVEVDLPDGADILALLEALSAKGSERFRSALFHDGKPDFLLRVARNHVALDEKDYSNALADGDEIVIFSVVAGG